MVVEHLVNLGRRSAEERMAHFLLELGARLKLVGIGNKNRIRLSVDPISSGRCFWG